MSGEDQGGSSGGVRFWGSQVLWLKGKRDRVLKVKKQRCRDREVRVKVWIAKAPLRERELWFGRNRVLGFPMGIRFGDVGA